MSSISNQQFELAIGRLLRLGIGASSVCLATGLVIVLVGGDSTSSRVLITSGVLILLATPAARIVLGASTYARQREWLMTALTLIVAAELVASVIAAFSGN